MYFLPITIILTLAAVPLGLLSMTLLLIRRAACRDIQQRGGIGGLVILEGFRWVLLTLSLFFIVLALAPMQVSLLFAGLLYFFLLQSHWMRSARELRLFGSILVATHRAGGSIPDVLEAYGRTNPTMNGARAQLTAQRLRSGGNLLAESERFHLCLPVADRLELAEKPTGAMWRRATPAEQDADAMLVSKLAMLTVYVPLVVMIAIMIFTFLFLWILPTLQEMFEEFDLQSSGVELIAVVCNVVLPIMVAVMSLAVLYVGAVLFFWIIGFDGALRMLPCYGRIIRDRRRILLLDSLAATTSRGIALPDALRSLSRVAMGRGEGRLLDRCVRELERGRSWSQAMTGLLDRHQIDWAAAAEQNGHLPATLSRIGTLVRNRVQRYAELCVAVAIPLAVFLLAIPVIMVCYGMISALADLTMALV
jgi:hypothetical protein